MDFWETFATTTGTAVDFGGGAVFAVHPQANRQKSAMDALLKEFKGGTDTVVLILPRSTQNKVLIRTDF
jgi:hypothetical protein